MNLANYRSYYRFASKPGSPIEDGIFINPHSGIYGVIDTDSAAFSPANPPLVYEHNLSGGEMIVNQMAFSIAYAKVVENYLSTVNKRILGVHQIHGKDPVKGDDVAGAGFAFCQLGKQGIDLFLGADCFAVAETRLGPIFFTAFDEAAFALEAQDNARFAQIKEQVGGSIGAAWDVYYPEYKKKRERCKNRSIGEGGHPSLNGDPALMDCMVRKFIPWSQTPRTLILGTDGLLPPSEVAPENFYRLATTIFAEYHLTGIDDVIDWRDRVEAEAKNLAHIEGHPEAAAVILEFAE